MESGRGGGLYVPSDGLRRGRRYVCDDLRAAKSESYYLLINTIANNQYVGDDELIRSVFLQILDGITQLHSYGIVHRDLKCENIVCSDDGRRVRICDFGLATSEVHSSEFGCGSTFYIAPESIGENRATRKSYPTKPGDIWSLGVILVNLVCARNPWRSAITSDKTFNTYLQDPSFLRRILPISLELQTILQGIFRVDPEERVQLRTLREQIRNCATFSMSQEELIAVHAAAARASQPRPTRVQDLEGMEEEDEDEEMSDDDYESEDEGSTRSVRLRSSYASEEGRNGSMLFELEVEDGDIPYLQPDTGSPSPPVLQSRSSSGRSGSLPPTPFYLNQSKFPSLHNTDGCLIDGCVLCHATGIRSDSRLSPNDITVAMPDPFFAPSKSIITNPRLASVVPPTYI